MRSRREVILLVRASVLAPLVGLVIYFLALGFPALLTPYSPTLYGLGLKGGGWLGYRLGFIGTVMLLISQLYSLKIFKLKQSQTSSKTWLDIHCYFGLVGSILVLIHAGFPYSFTYANPFDRIYLGLGFRGLVGVQGIATWLVLMLAISGFFGKYLYSKLSPKIRRAFKTWLVLHVGLTGALYVTGIIHLYIVISLKHIAAA